MHESWNDVLSDEMKKSYFIDLVSLIKTEREKSTVYPPVGKVFTAFEVTSFDEVSVVVLGQDPYHGPGQAHGLAFSVLPNAPPPPSLRGIYKELRDDLGAKLVTHGYLMAWAKQGVFLLNTVLTVRQGEPGSHRKLGWEVFTDKVIKVLSAREKRIVFLLWGNDAKAKAEMISTQNHVVLAASHPSPLGAYKGFYGCKHFSRANHALLRKGLAPIDWQLPNNPLTEVPRPTIPPPNPLNKDLELDNLDELNDY
jgi:uracil-DNA glycosylase